VQHLKVCCEVTAVSPVYETKPVGKVDQPSFLNAAVLIETDLDPHTLKVSVLRQIEKELGRVRTQDKNAPRTIDLDVVLFGCQILDLSGRHIPNPELLKYAHLAKPIADIAPNWHHPEDGRTLAEIAASLPEGDIRLRPDITL
jgi:2-amino-4-hydroxy-6-hydroxymethyldihydropteridine diphosphokinase